LWGKTITIHNVLCGKLQWFSPHDLALLVIVILNRLNIKKIKSTNIILKKIITKKN
jgi:hypothetical protein